MKELSLHILDLVENSIAAGASTIELTITESPADNQLTIAIKDDGCGMSPETLAAVVDPFYTTRTTRDVGFGVPMFKMNVEACAGAFSISSTVGAGTALSGSFQYDHIDRPPLGDIVGTVVGIVMSLETCNLNYHHSYNDAAFELKTTEMREMLGADVSLSEVFVLQWVRDYVSEHLTDIRRQQ